MGRRFKSVVVLAAMTVAGAVGCGGTSDHEPTSGHSGLVGREGGGHALGADPKAEMKRIQQAGGSANAASPGRLPGR